MSRLLIVANRLPVTVQVREGEVEVELPERYRIDPRVASAMRAVPGVVEVELV